MKYLLTYCAMDSDIANPFWHACIILSQQTSPGQKIEVETSFGFYAAKMTESASLFAKLKQTLGFHFDFTGNFGVWKTEEIRWLDLGHGLRGMTFDVTFEQYENIKRVYQRRLKAQDDAIADAKAKLGAIADSPQSIHIFNQELTRAREEKREPRLDLFEFRVSFCWTGFTLAQSNTCKTMAVKLLREADIPEDYLDKITNNGESKVLPRIGNNLEKIILHSEGERKVHQSKRTGALSFFREWGYKDDKLYWTLPPQLYFSQDESKNPYFLNIDTDEMHYLKLYLRQLLRLDSLLAPLMPSVDYPGYYKYEHNRLVEHIKMLYTNFSMASSETTREKLLEYIDSAKYFLNSLYFAINDNWDDNYEIETVAARYPLALQEKICSVLERPISKDTLKISI